MQRLDYLNLRRAFKPTNVELVIVAESPPVSGKYFYSPEGFVSEPLFSALMIQLGLYPKSKAEGLREFRRRGWVLIDATYEPVNADGVDRDVVILRDYPLLRDDLAAIVPDRATPVVLLKANVCRLLESRLIADGFNVINRGRIVYFPSNGQQGKFRAQFSEILRTDGDAYHK